jgi:hypothetical protein
MSQATLTVSIAMSDAMLKVSVAMSDATLTVSVAVLKESYTAKWQLTDSFCSVSLTFQIVANATLQLHFFCPGIL